MEHNQGLLCPSNQLCFLKNNLTWATDQGYPGSDSDYFGNYNLSLSSDGGVPGAHGNRSLIDVTSVQGSINTFMQRYLTPVIIFVGVVGNIASLAVFRTSRLRRQSSTVHLSALAVSDTGFLITLLFSWLGWFRVNLVHQQPWCVLVVYLTYVCSFLSVWIVVIFTVERFIVACFPFHRKRILRKRTTKVVLAILIFVSLIGYSFATWMTGVIDVGGMGVCGYYPEYQRVMSILMHIDTAVTFVIPMSIIITLNSAIAVAVYRTQKSLIRCSQGTFERPTVLTYLEPSSMKSSSTYRNFSIKSSSKKNVVVTLSNTSISSQERAKRHIRSTKMLLVVSTVFVVLNLPVHTLKVHAVVKQMVHPDWRQPTDERLWMHTFELVYYFNFAINFFLYSLCAQNFRRCLLASCLTIRSKLVCCGYWSYVPRQNKPSQPPAKGTNLDHPPVPGIELKTMAKHKGGHTDHETLSDWSSASR